MKDRLGVERLPWIGWATAGRDIDTAANYVSQGDGSSGESGRTLIHCQAYDGRDSTVALDASRAQGRYLLAQCAQSVVTIPPFGATVLIATPTSYGTHPGNSVILLVVGDSPELASGEAILAALVGGSRVTVRKDGTIEAGQPSPTGFAGLASKIDQAVSTIVTAFNAHAHTGVTTGPGTSGPPATPISPAPGTTASAILKLSG